MSEVQTNRTGRLALTIGLGGVLFAVMISILGKLIETDLRMPAFAVFVAAQVAAIALGYMSRQTPLGRAAMITSSLLLVGSLTLIS